MISNTRALVTLEEHFVSEATRSWVSQNRETPGKDFPPTILNKLHNLGDGRLKDMDDGSVTLQVISQGPTHGSAPLETCRTTNDELKTAVENSKGRFAGFAMLPMSDPTAAAQELARCVETLGFVGALVNSHDNGRFYDDTFFWPIFSAGQSLDVPIYLHPTLPSAQMARGSGNYPDIVARGLDTYCWGWHSETGAHILRLFASGLFDEYPRLKLIIGHMGEMLPFMLDRIKRFASTQWPDRKRDLQTVWDQNIYVTTAGMFSVPPMACLLRVCKIEHVLYSVDYPFSSNGEGKEFMDELAQSGLCTDEELDKIAFGNAEALLGVKVPR